jgi:aspartyl-tRNA(Asn)/glutamyl-tRNA(Gln) amidotransferase subunit A
MPSNDEICRMEATELAGRVRAKELSPVEVMDAVLDRMEKLEPTLHAFCTPTPEMAREEARRLEKEISDDRDPGPLAGVPVGIKDLHAVKDVRMVLGSHAYKDFVPDDDDVAVERLKEAGAIVLGKTNVPEFGYSGVGHNPVFETTTNPWDTRLTPGGSSAGSGAAVASGMGPIALGSDGGGSVRIPSSFCGLFGMKASMGRVPLYPSCRDERYPGASGWESLEHIGPMSRTVRDGALMLSVMAGPDDRDRHSLPKEVGFDPMEALGEELPRGLRVAYSPDWGYAAVDPEVRRVVGEAAKVFEDDLGCTVEEAHPGFEDPFEAFWGLVLIETDLAGMRKMAGELGEKMSPHLSAVLEQDWKAEDFTNAVMMRKAVYNRMWRFMRDYDLLLTPTLAVPPFETGIQGPEIIEGREVANTYWLSFTFPINMTGQPAATVPAGFTEGGLPVGMQIVGRHLEDGLVLKASAAFEAARPWKDRWPGLLEEVGL